jgi:hypothetical protein
MQDRQVRIVGIGIGAGRTADQPETLRDGVVPHDCE